MHIMHSGNWQSRYQQPFCLADRHLLTITIVAGWSASACSSLSRLQSFQCACNAALITLEDAASNLFHKSDACMSMHFAARMATSSDANLVQLASLSSWAMTDNAWLGVCNKLQLRLKKSQRKDGAGHAAALSVQHMQTSDSQQQSVQIENADESLSVRNIDAYRW